jgi:hypothetical protein
VKHALTILVTAGLIACGGEPEPQQQPDHIWKSQTDMINRAGEVEGLVGESSARQREQIDSQAQ